MAPWWACDSAKPLPEQPYPGQDSTGVWGDLMGLRGVQSGCASAAAGQLFRGEPAPPLCRPAAGERSCASGAAGPGRLSRGLGAGAVCECYVCDAVELLRCFTGRAVPVRFCYVIGQGLSLISV